MRKASGSQALNAQLATLNSRLERLCITDELTGLFNRRHAMSRLEEQWALVERYGRPLTIAMIDIDHSRRSTTPTATTPATRSSAQVASHPARETRGTDALCRVGGEEFLIIFPQQTLQEALICRRAMPQGHGRQSVYHCPAAVRTSRSASGWPRETARMTQFTDLLKAADHALYAAKHGGRNSS